MSEVENTTAETPGAATTGATPVAPPKAPEPKPVTKIDAAAQQVKAEAAAKTAPAKTAAAKAAPAKAAAAKPATPAKQPASKTVRKTATKKTSKPAVKQPAPAKKAATPAAVLKTNPVTKLKETIMATAQNTDFTATAKEMLADVQTRAKTVYTKTGEFTAEATEFTKANVEAVVESGKIFIAGAQELLKDNIETGKTVIETVTEDAKKVAAVKSPTELMQLQGEIARRNFDAMVSYGSKRTEAWVKLYNDAFAPISNRVSVAAEKIKTAA